MNHLSFVYPYYRNPKMLARQYREWANYPDELKSKIDIVIVDDGSPEPAIDVERQSDMPPLRIFRVLVDKPWNQHGARNLGASVADGPWLFLSDMDHILPAKSLSMLLAIDRPRIAFMFNRLDIDTMTPTRRPDGKKKPHPNSFAMTREIYWKAGGYDEDYEGYGTDSLFRRRVSMKAPIELLHDVSILRVSRDVIDDASTTTYSRAARCDRDATIAKKRREGRLGKIAILNFPWERVL